MFEDFTIFVKESDMPSANVTNETNQTYNHLTMDWPQSVYYAWVMYGAVAYQVGLYWIQRYYMENWYAVASEYKSGNPGAYTNWGLGETINRLALLGMWALTAFFWTLSNIKMEWFYWFFTIWAKILHFVDLARLLTVLVFKTVAMFRDTREDYLIVDGTNMDTGNTTKVSIAQQLVGTDWYMESFSLTVSFSLYGDLLGISEWARRD